MLVIVKDEVVVRFRNDGTMLNLRIFNRKAELHGGSTAISITLFFMVYFLSSMFESELCQYFCFDNHRAVRQIALK